MSITLPFGASLPAGRCNKSHTFSECSPVLLGLGGEGLSSMWVGKSKDSYEHQGKHLPAAGVSQQTQPCLSQPKGPASQREALKCPGEEAALSKAMHYVFLTSLHEIKEAASLSRRLFDGHCAGSWAEPGGGAGQGAALRQEMRRRVDPKAQRGHLDFGMLLWVRVQSYICSFWILCSYLWTFPYMLIFILAKESWAVTRCLMKNPATLIVPDLVRAK